MQNPFTLVFGKDPIETIERPLQIKEITEVFCAENLNQQVYMITGIRGSGKTVLMTQISNILRESKDWVVVELNPETDLLMDLASKLSSQNYLASIFRQAKINLSFFGLGLEIDGVNPITNIESATTLMLETISKQGKRILITIDEATNTTQMRTFAAAFQIFVRKNLPVCLLMTGLFENIRNIQDQKSLTFLYRSPRVDLGSLNMNAIAERYKRIFNLDDSSAREMSNLTFGYPFAFQILGYLTFRNNGDYKNILPSYRQYLEDFAYDKIWSELSPKDKKITKAIAGSSDSSVMAVRNLLGITNDEFNPYKRRLVQSGILNGSERGIVKFSLPFFKEFVLSQI